MALEDKQHAEVVRSRIDMIVDAQEMGGGNIAVRRRKPFDTKNMIWALIIMGVIIVGLITAIILVNVFSKEEDTRPYIVRKCYRGNVSEIVQCVNENSSEDELIVNYGYIIDAMNSEYNEYDMDITIQNYQAIIDETEGDLAINLMIEEMREIMMNDMEKEYGAVALEIAKQIYGILNDASSAARVLNVAMYYNYTEVINEYMIKMEEYQSDTEQMETIG